jgi:hypothetical protein
MKNRNPPPDLGGEFRHQVMLGRKQTMRPAILANEKAYLGDGLM